VLEHDDVLLLARGRDALHLRMGVPTLRCFVEVEVRARSVARYIAICNTRI
jgi:hypothetical protein